MMKKIAVIPPIPLPEYERNRRKVQYESSAGRGYSIDIRSLKGGPALTDSEYALMRAVPYMADEAEQAEAEGACAAVIDCTADPGLTEIRQALKIPVTGSLQAALGLAFQTGREFSVIALDNAWAGMIERKITEYGMRGRLVSVEVIGSHIYSPSRNSEMTDSEYQSFFSTLLERGKDAAEAGADTLILGSTTIIRGWKELEAELGIPVIAPGIAALKTAELLLETDIIHSEKAYPFPE